MSYRIYRGGDGRFVLRCSVTGAIVGLLFCPGENESRRAFEYDFGSTEDRNNLLNVDEFPELEKVSFFAIESLGYHDYDRCLYQDTWTSLRPLFLAEGKAIGYHSRPHQSSPSVPENLLWKYTPPNPRGSWKIPAWALHINEKSIWMGNRDGLILSLDHGGRIVKELQLPKITRCLVGNDRYFYASCDDGNLYDLTGKEPQIVYQFRSSSIPIWRDFTVYSLDLRGDRLHIADIYGQISQLDSSLQLLWQVQTDYRQTWFLESDDRAVYQGHDSGVAAWDINTGKVLWCRTTEAVLCGAIVDDFILIGTSDRCLYQLPKMGDRQRQITEVTRFVELEGAPYSCTFSSENNLLFVADHLGNLYIFSRTGEPLGKYSTNCGVILNLGCFGDRLYATTSDGSIAVFSIDFPRQTPPNFSLGQNSEDRSAIVECFLMGNKLKVRPISPGYPADRSVRFPRQLRLAGARYRVEELREVQGKGYYIARGRIERID